MVPEKSKNLPRWKKKRFLLILLPLTLIALLTLFLKIPRSDFVTRAALSEENGYRKACFFINPDVLWRPMNHAAELNGHILKNLKVTINQNEVAAHNINVMNLMTLYVKYDPFGFGIIIGSVGGSSSVCVNINNLESGSYTLVAETTTTWGELYSYTWTFDVQ